MMIHRRTSLKKVASQALDLSHVVCRRAGIGVYAKPWIAFLKFHQFVVRLHGILEGVLVAAETIVKIRCAIQREFYGKQLKTGFILQDLC